MQSVTIAIYSFKELNKEAKNKAITEHREFLIDTFSDDLFEASWNMTRSKYAKQLTKADIVESIETNDYFYFSNGELAHVIQFCEQHPRAGDRAFYFKDAEYTF